MKNYLKIKNLRNSGNGAFFSLESLFIKNLASIFLFLQGKLAKT